MSLNHKVCLKILVFTVSLASLDTMNTFAFMSPGVRSDKECGVAEPNEGPLPFNRKFRLGKPVDFDDGSGINGGLCFPLYEGSRLVTWLDSYHQSGTRVYFRRCIEDRSITKRSEIGVGNKSGYVEETYTELQPGNKNMKFVELRAPFWSDFASPSFCRLFVAYWGTKFKKERPAEVYAVVLNLKTKKVIKKIFLGATQIESDSRAYFPRPRWAPGGNEVRFDNFVGEGESRIERVGVNNATVSLR